MGRLDGKTVLITAASAGIGRASAIAAAKEGARVIATDIDGAGLSTLPDEIETALLDVRDSAAVTAAAARVGRLDGLFNCAGFVHGGTILEATEADWDFAFDLNVKAMFRMVRAFLPGMLDRAKETGSVSVVNMASIASSLKGVPNRAVYGASKAAVIGLTKACAADYVKQGLRINALCPGTVDTPSLRSRIAQAKDPEQQRREFLARQPTGKLAEAEDIAPMVIYLLSDESRFMTGQAVLVDGGMGI
jgi:2-keto-3-deoxy-L-fuconate dehydrogenase